MTTFENKILTCAVCGEKSEYTLLMSTNSMGMDLDLRPCGMKRATLGSEIQICPHCKYVAYDIEKKVSKKVHEYVLSSEYNTSICVDSFFGGFSTEAYLNIVEISLIAKDYEGAFFALLKAAWVADDRHKLENAINYRKRALSIIYLIPEEVMDKDTRCLLSVDLYRRTRNFEEAMRLCQEYNADSEFVARQRIYEYKLAEKGDDIAHQMRYSLE